MKAENCIFLKFVFVFPWNLSFFPSNIVLLRMSLLINIWFSSQSVEVLKGHVDTVFFFFHFTSTWVLAETIHQREKIFLKYQHPVQNAKLVIYFFKISTVLIQHQQRLNTMIPYWYIGFYLNNYIKNMGIRNFM